MERIMALTGKNPALWILSTYYLAQVLIVVNAQSVFTPYPPRP